MKHIPSILAISFLACIFTSCEKFLDVQPKTEIQDQLLFKDEQGFKDALTGVYISLQNTSSYGRSLTQTTLEQLINSWDVTSGSLEQRIGLYQYDDEGVQNEFNKIFKQQYKSIAQINAILTEIDVKEKVFKNQDTYKLLKAECLGLRAMVHFDLIRLYGPMPLDPAIGSKLPYVTTFGKQSNTPLSYEAFQAEVLKDLNSAEELLSTVDPILHYRLDQLRSPSLATGFNPEDDIYAYRYLRMNYYAIKGLQARAHLWYGQHQQALEAALTVIQSRNADQTLKFKLGTAADLAENNFNFSHEHLFGLYDFKMYDNHQALYSTIILKKGTTVTSIKNTLFGNTGTDIRESELWELLTMNNGAKGHTIKKYAVQEPKLVTTKTDYKQIPLIRLSEMYLIAAECAPYEEGLAYLATFRTARNIAQLVPTTKSALQAEILKEYRKEFYAEGQAFYAYKRNNSPKSAIIFTSTIGAATVNYTMPLPTVETVNQ